MPLRNRGDIIYKTEDGFKMKEHKGNYQKTKGEKKMARENSGKTQCLKCREN